MGQDESKLRIVNMEDKLYGCNIHSPIQATNPFKTEKIFGGTNEYRRIQAWEAKDYDGEPSNWKQGTTDGDRWLTERKFIPLDKGEPVRYTNFW